MVNIGGIDFGRFSRAEGWKLDKNSNLKFAGKNVKITVEVKSNNSKVTGQRFLEQILKEINNDPSKSEKLQSLKENGSVELTLGKNGTKYTFINTDRQTEVAERVTTATDKAMKKVDNKGPPPPINRATKPKPKTEKQLEEENKDMWNRLGENGEVTL